MPTTTPLQDLPIPEATDPDNVPADFSSLAGAIEGRLVMRFSSTAARDAAITSPVEGMVAYVTGDDEFTVYTGSAWVAFGQSGEWKPYTPVLTAATTNPTLGGGSTLEGWYFRSGNLCHFRINLTIGSGFSGGSGTWRFSTPFTMGRSVSGAGGSIGLASLYDVSATTRRMRYAYQAAPTYLSLIGESDGLTVSPTTPFTWASGDSLSISGTFEVG